MRVARSRPLVVVLALVATSLLGIGQPSQAAPGPSAKAAAAPSARPAGKPLGRAAVALARAHLREHADEFGLGGDDTADLTVASVVPTEHNGLTHVYFQQQVQDLDVINALVNVAVDADGSIFSVTSSAVASAAKLANRAAPKLSDVQAAARAASALGLKPTGSFAGSETASGVSRARLLAPAGISQDPIPVRLVYAPTAKGALRLAWELGINQLDGEHWWQIRVDAATGAEVSRNDWVAADSHNVFPLPVEAPTFASPVNTRTVVSNPATSASPFGWNDTNGAAGPESTLTQGNNVNAYTDVDNDNAPDAGGSPDGGAGLNFNFPLDLTQPPSAYRPAAVSNLYFTNNRIHDILYRFGFNEAAGNFQVNNYGHGGSGNDAVNAEAQDGGGSNNANFSTPPDGSAPRMQMYVWTAPDPDRDGDLDNGIIIHEYGHGVSNRLTGGPATTSCLGNTEQGGEGWSDYLAYMLTMPNGTEPAGGRGIGTYALNEATNGPGIRTQKYSTSMAINNETYDSIKTMTAPHGVGEVWAEMLWEVTYALIGAHGFSANLSGGPSTAGNILSLQLVLDGMKLQPCNPGFVDARDAIIAADQADTGGANRCLLWTAFAKRGLGFSASQGSSGNKTDGIQAFDLPPVCLGLVMTRSATPTPVPAGRPLTYGFHLENTSSNPGGMTGVVATGHVGDHATFVPGSATCSGTYDAGTKVVTFPVGTMALGTTRDCEFQVTIASSPFSTTVLSDDFEPDLSAWTATHGSGSVDWTLSTVSPHSPTHAAFASEPGSVADQYLTLNTPVPVAAGGQLSFWHTRDIEGSGTTAFDGGVVEVSTDGTTWNDIGAAAFTQNGYTHTVSSGFGNPLGGRPAFSGTSSYVRSVASLAAYAGQSVQVRFRMGTDNSVGKLGWRVDDVEIGTDVQTVSTGTAAANGVPPYAVDISTQIVAPVTGAPDPPTVTGSTPSAGAVSVAFTPGSDGGSPITGFTAQCVSTDGGATGSVSGAASPLSVGSLSPGKSYHCRVRATNAIGTGAFSAFGTTVQVPATAPAAPTVTGSTPSAGAVSVAFTPGSDGGSPITGFTAQCVSTDAGATGSTSGAASPLSVSGLSPGKHYHCRVRATNAAGTSAFSAFGSTVLVPATAPGAPTVTGSTPSTGAVSVAFTPGSDGGSPITGFTAECVSTDGGATGSVSGAASPLSVSGLSPGKHYHCRVRATNAIGTGAFSAFGSTVLVPATAPAAPTVTGSTPSSAAVSVAFTPGGDGGSPITGFAAECVSTDGGSTGSTTGPASPLSVGSLSTGKHYHCRVRATNANGTGAFSAFGSTVLVPAPPPPPPPPTSAPGRPVITSAVPVSKRKAKISFTLASDGGSPVTSYSVTCKSKNGGKKRSRSGSASPIKVKRLTPGKKYKCTVRATNAVGTGPTSRKSKLIKMPTGRGREGRVLTNRASVTLVGRL